MMQEMKCLGVKQTFSAVITFIFTLLSLRFLTLKHVSGTENFLAFKPCLCPAEPKTPLLSSPSASLSSHSPSLPIKAATLLLTFITNLSQQFSNIFTLLPFGRELPCLSVTSRLLSSARSSSLSLIRVLAELGTARLIPFNPAVLLQSKGTLKTKTGCNPSIFSPQD